MMTYDLPRIVSVQKDKNVNAYVTLEFDSYRDFIMKIMFDDEIDEEHYFKENPDVLQAVKNGQIPSGNYHFKGIGYVEGRKFRSNHLAAKAPAAASTNPASASTNHDSASTNHDSALTNPASPASNPASASTNPTSASTNPTSTSTNPTSTSTKPASPSTNSAPRQAPNFPRRP